MSPENRDDTGEGDRGDGDTASMGRREALADTVATSLSRDERETGVDYIDSEDRYSLFSYAPSIVRSILRHDLAAINWVYVDPPRGRKYREENLGEIPLSKDNLKIEGVSASLPVGTLSIKGSARSTNASSGIVSTPAQAEKAAEAFGGGGSE
jgi:hypothetical protein